MSNIEDKPLPLIIIFWMTNKTYRRMFVAVENLVEVLLWRPLIADDGVHRGTHCTLIWKLTLSEFNRADTLNVSYKAAQTLLAYLIANLIRTISFDRPLFMGDTSRSHESVVHRSKYQK